MIQLHKLDFSSNRLVGQIPKQLGKLTSLTSLTLNGNQLSGDIPLELGLLAELGYLDLSANRLSKLIPKNLGELRKLHHLNLSNNQFSQEISIQIGKLVQLSKLDWSHNSLGGKIPSEICNLESLEYMNLSQNKLSGPIPSCFRRMHGLSSIDLSYNELQGSIPHSKAFQNATIEAFQGNKELCGDVIGLPPCEALTSNKGDSGKHMTFLFVIVPLLSGAFLLSLVLIGMCFNFRRRKRTDSQEGQNDVNNQELLSASTFEGKMVYEEIIKATKDFDDRYCMGQVDVGLSTKQS